MFGIMEKTLNSHDANKTSHVTQIHDKKNKRGLVKKCCMDLINKKSPSNSIQIKNSYTSLNPYNIAKCNEPIDEQSHLYKSVDCRRVLEEENELLKQVLEDNQRLFLTRESQLLKRVIEEIDKERVTKNELKVQCKRETRVKPAAKILQCVTIPCNKKKPFHILFDQLFPPRRNLDKTQNYKIGSDNLDLCCSNNEDDNKGVNFGQEDQGRAVNRIILNSICSQGIDDRMSEDTYRSSEDVEEKWGSCYEANMFGTHSLKDDASVNRKIKYINFAENQKTLSHSADTKIIQYPNDKIIDFGIPGSNFSGGIEELRAEENKPLLKDGGAIGNGKNSSNQTTQNCSENIKWFCVPVNKKTEINSFTEENQANCHSSASNISIFNMKKTVNEEIDETRVTNEEENIPIQVEQDERGTSNQRLVHNNKTYYGYKKGAKQHPQSEYNDESSVNSPELEYNDGNNDFVVKTSSDHSLSPVNRTKGFHSSTRARKRAKKGHSDTTRFIKADMKSTTSSKRESNEFESEKCSNIRATLSVKDDILGLTSSDSSVHPENRVKAYFRPTKAKKSTQTTFVKDNTKFPSTSSKRESNKIQNDKPMDCLDEPDSKFKEYSLVNLFRNINRVRNMIVTMAGRDDLSAEIKNETFKSIGTSLEQHIKFLEGINSDEILEVALPAPGTKETKHDKLINRKIEPAQDTKFKTSRANDSSVKYKVIDEYDGEESVIDNIGSVDHPKIGLKKRNKEPCYIPFWKRTALNSPVTSGVMERSVGEDSNRVMNQTLPNYRKRNFIEDYYNKSFTITKKSKYCRGKRPKMKSSEWTVEKCESEEIPRNQNVLSFFKHTKLVKEKKRNVKTKKIGCFKSKNEQNRKFLNRRRNTKARLLKTIKESQNCVLKTDLEECKPILSGNIAEYPEEQGGRCSRIEESKHNVDVSILNQPKVSDESMNFSNQKIKQPKSINQEILQTNPLLIPNRLQKISQLEEIMQNILRSNPVQQDTSQPQEITQENQKSIPSQASSLTPTHSGKCREENTKLINSALKKSPEKKPASELYKTVMRSRDNKGLQKTEGSRGCQNNKDHEVNTTNFKAGNSECSNNQGPSANISLNEVKENCNNDWFGNKDPSSASRKPPKFNYSELKRKHRTVKDGIKLDVSSSSCKTKTNFEHDAKDLEATKGTANDRSRNCSMNDSSLFLSMDQQENRIDDISKLLGPEEQTAPDWSYIDAQIMHHSLFVSSAKSRVDEQENKS